MQKQAGYQSQSCRPSKVPANVYRDDVIFRVCTYPKRIQLEVHTVQEMRHQRPIHAHLQVRKDVVVSPSLGTHLPFLGCTGLSKGPRNRDSIAITRHRAGAKGSRPSLHIPRGRPNERCSRPPAAGRSRDTVCCSGRKVPHRRTLSSTRSAPDPRACLRKVAGDTLKHRASGGGLPQTRQQASKGPTIRIVDSRRLVVKGGQQIIPCCVERARVGSECIPCVGALTQEWHVVSERLQWGPRAEPKGLPCQILRTQAEGSSG
eukprot:scaffold1414_cov384-Prasinococcus_capsulatus_cf.AAC.2